MQRGSEIEPGEKADALALGIESVGMIVRLKDRLQALSDARSRRGDVDRDVAEAREKYSGTMRALELMMGQYDNNFMDLDDLWLLTTGGVITGKPDLLRLTSKYFDEPECHDYLPISDALSAEIARMQKLPKGIIQSMTGWGCTRSLFRLHGGTLDEYPLDRDADRMGVVDLVKWRSVKELNPKR